MTNFAKRVAALKILAQTSIKPANYQPALTRVLWQMGIDVPPPHFCGFWTNVVTNGVMFGVLWGLFMAIVVWSREGKTPGEMFAGATLGGVLFGLAMAVYYARARQKHHLPAWQDINPHS